MSDGYTTHVMRCGKCMGTKRVQQAFFADIPKSAMRCTCGGRYAPDRCAKCRLPYSDDVHHGVRDVTVPHEFRFARADTTEGSNVSP